MNLKSVGKRTKISALILAAVFLFAFAACAGETTPPPAEPQGTESSRLSGGEGNLSETEGETPDGETEETTEPEQEKPQQEDAWKLKYEEHLLQKLDYTGITFIYLCDQRGDDGIPEVYCGTGALADNLIKVILSTDGAAVSEEWMDPMIVDDEENMKYEHLFFMDMPTEQEIHDLLCSWA